MEYIFRSNEFKVFWSITRKSGIGGISCGFDVWSIELVGHYYVDKSVLGDIITVYYCMRLYEYTKRKDEKGPRKKVGGGR